MKTFPLAAVILAWLSSLAGAQVSYNNSPYTQNFDSLISTGSTPWTDNSTLPGWYGYTVKKGPFITMFADNGRNGATNAIYSYGQSGVSNRALGIQPGSTPGDVMMGVRVTNNTSRTINAFTLFYDGEQWRAYCTAPQTLTFSYQLGSPATLNSGTWTPVGGLNFTGPVVSQVMALNGTSPANMVPNIGCTVNDINWGPGTDLWLRWYNANQPGGNASLAVDNLSFSGTTDAIVYAGGTYSETFDTLPVSGTSAWQDSMTLPGWYAFEPAKGTPFAVIDADNGRNGSTGYVYSYGVSGSNERALGVQAGSTPGNSMLGVRLRNNTGQALTSFTISYEGEQWRASCTAPQLLRAAYQIGAPANLNSGTWTLISGLNFTGPVVSSTGALVGNASPNCIPNITYSVPVNWPAGADLWIRFDNGGPYASLSGNAGLAINNFTFSANNTTTFPDAYFLQQECLDSIAQLDQMITSAGPGGVPIIRQFTKAARLALAMGIPNAVPKAEYYMARAFGAQLSSGSFPWYVNSATPDANGTEFAAMPLAVIFSRYQPMLDGTFVSYAMPHLQSALTAIMPQNPGTGYTNIATMQAMNEILLGQIVGSGTGQSKGLSDLNTWITSSGGIQPNGIAEYDSPTYSMIDFINLAQGYNNLNPTNAAHCGAQLKGALDFVSFDLCVNYIDGYTGSIAGAASRDYTFTVGDDAVGHFYYYAGLRPELPFFQPFDDGMEIIPNVMEGGYLPSAAIAGIGAGMPTRAIVQKVGAPVGNVNIGKDRYTYITPDFAIGSTSRFYSFDDKQISAAFVTSAPTSQINVVYDNNDNPYGTVLGAEPGTGLTKPLHLENSPVTIQAGGTILSMSNLYPQFALNSGSYNSLATDFTFPMNADALYLDGNLITGTNTIMATGTSVFGVQKGNAVVAIRLFAMDGYNGYTPAVYVKFDGQELVSNQNPNVPLPDTGRLVVYQYVGPYVTPSGTTSLRSGFVMAGSTITSGSDAVAFLNQVASAPLSSTVTSGTWSASITLSGTTLAAQASVPNGNMISRTVNGRGYVPQIYTITSGTTTTDYSAIYLQSIPPQN